MIRRLLLRLLYPGTWCDCESPARSQHRGPGSGPVGRCQYCGLWPDKLPERDSHAG